MATDTSSLRLIVGRSNLSINVFVPWDCENSCPFCTTKSLYSSMDLSLSNVIASLKELLKTDIREIVITGGEPFSNIEGLDKILETICEHDGKKVYINTSFPKKTQNDKTIELIEKYRCFVRGINVSRHNGISSYEDLLFLRSVDCRIPVRINHIVDETTAKHMTTDDIEKLIYDASFVSSSLCFRYDYRKVRDTEQLKSIHSNDFLNRLFEIESISYVNSNGCLVCNTDVFIYKQCMRDYDVLFHRGIQKTYIRTSMYGIINDIVLFPNGVVRLDWNENDPVLIYHETSSESNENKNEAALVSLKKTDLWNAFEKTVGKERTEKDIENEIYKSFQNTVNKNQNQCKYDDGWNDLIRIANIARMRKEAEERLLKEYRERQISSSCGGGSC